MCGTRAGGMIQATIHDELGTATTKADRQDA